MSVNERVKGTAWSTVALIVVSRTLTVSDAHNVGAVKVAVVLRNAVQFESSSSNATSVALFMLSCV